MDRLRQGATAIANGLRRARPILLAVGKSGAVLALVLGAVAVGRLITRQVEKSPAFATRAILIEGNARLTEEEITRAAGLAVGLNVFKRSAEAAERALERHPWVSSAEVVRQLPDTYHVRIEERRAVAVLVMDRMFLVDNQGNAFKAVEEGDPVDLPVITGLTAKRYREDQTGVAATLLEVVALLHDWRGAGLYRREPIAEIHVHENRRLDLYIGDDATQVRLGRAPYRQKLDRLRKVLDRLGERKARPLYVYLDNQRRPDRVTVRVR